jgi:hypothetical protein
LQWQFISPVVSSKSEEAHPNGVCEFMNSFLLAKLKQGQQILHPIARESYQFELRTSAHFQ